MLCSHVCLIHNLRLQQLLQNVLYRDHANYPEPPLLPLLPRRLLLLPRLALLRLLLLGLRLPLLLLLLLPLLLCLLCRIPTRLREAGHV